MEMNLNHLSRYKDIARLLWKYGRSDLVKQMAIDDQLAAEKEKEPTDAGETPPEQLADDLEAMGATFVKLGQVLSSRPDLLPTPYLKALARLQDKVNKSSKRSSARGSRARSRASIGTRSPVHPWDRSMPPRCATAARSW